MSLTLQSIVVATAANKQETLFMPAEHIYPFIIHRLVDETREKENGSRQRYSKTHVVSHLYSGAQVGRFPSYAKALAVVQKMKDWPIWIMPTIKLLQQHPDWQEASREVRSLKREYGH
jgi:hypothetical protein